MFMSDALAHAKRMGDSYVAGAMSFRQPSAIAMSGAGSGSVGQLSKSTMAQTQEQYRHNTGWVAAVVRTISSRVSGQSLKVARVLGEREQRKIDAGALQLKSSKAYQRYRRHMNRQGKKESLPGTFKDYHGRLEVLDNHPIHQLTLRPNPIMTRSALMGVTVSSLELTGRSYWWFYDPPESPGNYQLWPLPSSWVEPKHTDMALYAEWEVRPPGIGETINVPGAQIGYMYYPDPSNPLGALAPLQANARSVVADEAIAEAQRRGFSQGLFPGLGIVIGRHPDVAGVPGQRPILSKSQRATLIAAIKQAYRGVQNEGEPVLMDGLIDDVKQLTLNPKDMGFMESGKYTKERITQGWGVNPISMGQVEGANRASSAVADDHLCGNVINPRLTQISEVLTRWLPPLFGERPGETIVYIEACHSFDADLELAVETSLYDKGAMSRNELRARHGLPPIKDGNSCFVQGFGEIIIEPEEDQVSAGEDRGVRFIRLPYR